MIELKVKQFGRMAVVMGGVTEREVSLDSGHEVLQALLTLGVDAYALEVNDDVVTPLIENRPDWVFNTMHGGFGEGGGLTAICQALHIPITGSSYAASALALDKYRAKLVWQALGLPTTQGRLLQSHDTPEGIVQEFGLPVVVKANHGGSTIGTTIVKQAEQLSNAIAYAQEFDHEVLLEHFVDQGEYTCLIIGERVFPSIRIKAQSDFYDYDAKYKSDDTVFLCPSDLSEPQEQHIRQLALQAFQALDCRCWGRVDFMRDQNGQFLIMELNTVPGMTSHSLSTKAVKAEGMDFNALVAMILLQASDNSS